MGKITKEAITKFNAGIEAGFNEIYSAFYYELCVYSHKITNDWHESEDIVQKGFLSFWQKCRYMQTESQVRATVYKIIRNESIRYTLTVYRRIRKSNSREDAEINELAYPQYDKETEELLNRIVALVNTELTHSCKKVVQMQLAGLKTEKISKALGIKFDTVHNHRSLAVKRLKKALNIK